MYKIICVFYLEIKILIVELELLLKNFEYYVFLVKYKLVYKLKRYVDS